ncbi:Hypothetical protein ORPV_852 [Orpheovirus IHUMI-LCC2]|uniref:Uncharacterized protein n=1 Tax=Orpheovirus IHUMI-LCC2 TaxID=2023057 RepID=A0A2I2L5G0_9VIRU|nr:Hypothetical protein ORPV_852 [Orpheovirus IHUMI-LCC2]SNW62756.1 Hypothetical protein ORPV_852 [Orpheovirus IHUMI-LCC2]
MDTRDKLAPNYIFSELPIDINREIIKKISPYDIPSFCHAVRTSKNINPTQCDDLIEEYYSKKGLQIFNKLSINEIQTLTNVIWPTTNFVNDFCVVAKSYRDINYIMYILDRAFSLRYETEVLKKMIDSITKLINGKFGANNYFVNINNIIFKYNRTDIANVNVSKLYPFNILGDHIINGGYDNKRNVEYSIFINLIYSTYPRLLFLKLINNMSHGEREDILRFLYTGNNEDVHNYILTNSKIIKDDIKLIAYCVYTQRQSYDYNMAGYLLQLAKEGNAVVYNSQEYRYLYKYIICMNDINLYKITTHVINNNNVLSYKDISNIDIKSLNIEPLDNMVSKHEFPDMCDADPTFTYLSLSFLKKHNIKESSKEILDYVYKQLKILNGYNPISVFCMYYFSDIKSDFNILK